MQSQLEEARNLSTKLSQQPAASGHAWKIREIVPRTDWTNAGLATPQAAVETFCWAVASNDQIQFAKIALNHDGSAMAQDLSGKNLWFRNFELNNDGVESMRFVSVSQTDEDNATVSIELLGHPKGSGSGSLTPHEMQLRLRRNDGNWQIDVDRDRVQVSAKYDPAEAAEFLSKLKVGISNNPPQTIGEFLEKRAADKKP